MRVILLPLCGLLAAAGMEPLVSARDPGIYALSGDHAVAEDTTPSSARSVGGTATLLQRTTHICARLHTSFGVRFVFSTGLGVDELPVDVVILPPAMANHADEPQDNDHLASVLQAGDPHYYGWTFRDPSRLLPGRWHITLSHGGEVLLDQPFDIDFTCSVPIS